MNIDLIAALLTGLTIYSVFITIHYFILRRKVKRLEINALLSEISTLCGDIACMLKANPKKPWDKSEEAKDGSKETTS